MVRSMAMPSLEMPIMPVDPADADVSFENLLTRVVKVSNDCETEDKDEAENDDSDSVGLPMDLSERPLTPTASKLLAQNSIG